MTSKFIKHLPCPSCGSRDNNSLYDDGHTHCFGCETTTFPDKPLGGKEEVRTNSGPKAPFRPIPDVFHALADRHISLATARKYGVTNIQDETNDIKHVYPYYNKDGYHTANKLRKRSTKEFRWEGDAGQATLFGQHLFPAGSAKAITLVEGECDAMAAFEMHGSNYPVVSVHNAKAAAKNAADNFEYLNSFPRIVICFDRDDAHVKPDGTISYPGQEAALAVASMFPLGKVHILTLADYKDANEYLVAGQRAKFVKEWWQAPVYTPSGLKLGKDMWDEISAPKNYETVPYPWEGLNAKTYGIRLSELVVVTAETGVGKTSVLKEIEYSLLNGIDKDGVPFTTKGIGLLHLEEPNSDTALGLMSIAADKPLHLPDVRKGVELDELRDYYDRTVNTDRIVIWDHFGSNSIHEVLAKIRHMVALGCKYIVLDHLSIVVSDQSGDERKQLDEITTKLKTTCMELNIAVIAVIHQNRQGQIRGTAGVEQLANMVFKLHRDIEASDEWRRNVTKVVVQKNRFCGITGPGVYLFYDPGSGRLTELTKEEIARYEAGQTSEESWA